MNPSFSIAALPKALKLLISIFLFVLTLGFFSGLMFVEHTTNTSRVGIIENYNGNEDNEEAEEMKFKKSSHEMLNIIHTHLLSMSLIFFILGFLVYGTQITARLKYFLMIEPMLSVLFTFGGIYLIWAGLEWISVVVMISGFLMTASFGVSVLLIYRDIIRSNAVVFE